MIIGHLPSGYILSKLLADKIAEFRVNRDHLIIVGVIGGIAPDFDMLYFYFIDGRQHHHHSYWSHYPVIWITLFVAASVWYILALEKTKAILAVVFSAAVFLHLLLDSIVADVWWFAPFVNRPYALFTVPTLYKPWWLNFILHWSFALELILWLWAILLWRRTPALA